MIMAVPDTSDVGHVRSRVDINNYRYSAPELHQTNGHGMDIGLPITKESDMFGMAMVIYEVSSHCPTSSGVRVKLHINLLGLDR